MRISKSEVVSMYESGASSADIAEAAGCGTRNIRRVLRQAGADMRNAGRPASYEINEMFFREWTPDMTYVLGFIVTDGCINGNSVTIAQKDDQILRYMNEAMSSNCRISKRSNNGDGWIYTLSINRKSIVEDLAALGVLERKSLTVKFPEVPAEYLRHFIRGVMDGDGWFHKRGYTANVTTGSIYFAEGLRDVFASYGYNTRITTEKDRIHRVWVSGKDDIIRLGRWLYDDCGVLFMPEKRSRARANDSYSEILT